MSSEHQLLEFFSKYAQHELTNNPICAFDQNYFWTVLSPYAGLVRAELVISPGLGQQLTCQFDSRSLAATKGALNSDGKLTRFRLIKALINLPEYPHSNLIYIDTLKKEVIRFEPLQVLFPETTRLINRTLEAEFEKILPSYGYRMLHEHPKLPGTCSTSEMYILNKAMRIVTGYDRPLTEDPAQEEDKILRFADAIELEYHQNDNTMDSSEYGKAQDFKNKVQQRLHKSSSKSSPVKGSSKVPLYNGTLKEQNAQAAAARTQNAGADEARRATTSSKVDHINHLLKTKSVAEVNAHLNPTPPPVPPRTVSHVARTTTPPVQNTSTRSDGLQSSGSHTTTVTNKGGVTNVSRANITGVVRK